MIRSKLLSFATGIAIAAAITAGAHAQTRTLYVGMNGGTLERTFEQYLFPDFEKANDVRIVVVPGTSPEILAKATAAKERPQLNLMFLDDGLMYRAIDLGLCERLRPSPELDQIDKAARIKGDMAASVGMGMTGLGYNTRLFSEKGWPAPTSWMDLADPKFKGKVVFQSLSASTFGLHAFLMFNRIEGGDESNVGPGFAKFNDTIGKNVLEFIPNSAQLSEMIQTGDAAIFPITPSLTNTLKKQGVPVEYVQPKEGSVTLMYAACVIARNDEDDLTQKLAAYLLSASAQSAALAAGDFIPSNPNAAADSPEAQARLARFRDYMKTAITVDWDLINRNRPEWDKRWDRTVER